MKEVEGIRRVEEEAVVIYIEMKHYFRVGKEDILLLLLVHPGHIAAEAFYLRQVPHSLL